MVLLWRKRFLITKTFCYITKNYIFFIKLRFCVFGKLRFSANFAENYGFGKKFFFARLSEFCGKIAILGKSFAFAFYGFLRKVAASGKSFFSRDFLSFAEKLHFWGKVLRLRFTDFCGKLRKNCSFGKVFFCGFFRIFCGKLQFREKVFFRAFFGFLRKSFGAEKVFFWDFSGIFREKLQFRKSFFRENLCFFFGFFYFSEKSFRRKIADSGKFFFGEKVFFRDFFLKTHSGKVLRKNYKVYVLSQVFGRFSVCRTQKETLF